MDCGELLDLLPAGPPVGLGGCRSGKGAFDACEFNVTVFDGGGGGAGRGGGRAARCGGRPVAVSHGSLDRSDSDALIHYDNMRILRDGSWELRMLLSRVRQRRAAIFGDYARNCLASSIFCAARAEAGIGSDAFAPCWEKSSLVYLASSILALGLRRPSPAHCLENLRGVGKKNPAADRIHVINDCMGMERATPSLLERMCKSTIGFAGEAGRRGGAAGAAPAPASCRDAGIIRAKYDYFVKNSMLADCYMYLTCVNHANFVSLKDSIHRHPDLMYILRVALDLENDPEGMRRNLGAVREACSGILSGDTSPAA